MSITKQQVLDNLEDVKKYIKEAEKEEIVKPYTKEDLIDMLRSDVEQFNLVVKLESDGGSWENLPKIGDKLDLSKANLSEANLSKADLSWANLSKADLSKANLSEANLSKANLSEANLSKANLSEANLSEANLSEANLSKADLFKSTFYGKGAGLELKKDQVESFLLALGFAIVD